MKTRPSQAPAASAGARTRREVPAYERICASLMEEIRQRDLKPHDLFLTVGEICARFATSRITAQRVLLELSRRGAVYTRPGSGTYVAPPPAPAGALGNTVSFLINNIVRDDNALPLVLRGAEAFAREQDFNLLVCNAQGDLSLLQEHVERLAGQGVRGVIFDIPHSGPFHNPSYELVRRLEAARIPVVLINKRFLDASAPLAYVGAENYGGTVKAIEHLAGLGHRRIAGIIQTNNASAIERLEGFRGGLLKCGAVFRPDLIRDFERLADLGPIVQALLALAERPTAIFCEHDVIAREVMGHLQAHGLRIPEDVALVGFDNLPFSPYLQPPLTTVAQPLEQIGREAMRVLLHRSQVEFAYYPQLQLPTELIVRASSVGSAAAPPGDS